MDDFLESRDFYLIRSGMLAFSGAVGLVLMLALLGHIKRVWNDILLRAYYLLSLLLVLVIAFVPITIISPINFMLFFPIISFNCFMAFFEDRWYDLPLYFIGMVYLSILGWLMWTLGAYNLIVNILALVPSIVCIYVAWRKRKEVGEKWIIACTHKPNELLEIDHKQGIHLDPQLFLL